MSPPATPPPTRTEHGAPQGAMLCSYYHDGFREEKLKEEVANYQSTMVTMQKDNKRIQKELTERQPIIGKLKQ